MDFKVFDDSITQKGWAKFPEILNAAQTKDLKEALHRTCAHQETIQQKNGVAANTQGAAHCILGYEKTLDTFLADLPLACMLDHFFRKPYILNNYGGVINFPGLAYYIHKPHRDVRDFTYPVRLMINMLVMLDDFTPENGATRVLEGSHRKQATNEQDIFAQKGVQITGQAGDIVLWDSNLLHAAGENTTNQSRGALTLCFARPYIKPTIDFLEALDDAFVAQQSPFAQRLLGVEARPAKNIEEFFQPPERWTYKMA